nr:serine/arginine repetitive matrix protein 1-like [Salvelinus alpinus]
MGCRTHTRFQFTPFATEPPEPPSRLRQHRSPDALSIHPYSCVTSPLLDPSGLSNPSRTPPSVSLYSLQAPMLPPRGGMRTPSCLPPATTMRARAPYPRQVPRLQAHSRYHLPSIVAADSHYHHSSCASPPRYFLFPQPPAPGHHTHPGNVLDAQQHQPRYTAKRLGPSDPHSTRETPATRHRQRAEREPNRGPARPRPEHGPNAHREPEQQRRRTRRQTPSYAGAAGQEPEAQATRGPHAPAASPHADGKKQSNASREPATRRRRRELQRSQPSPRTTAASDAPRPATASARPDAPARRPKRPSRPTATSRQPNASRTRGPQRRQKRRERTAERLHESERRPPQPPRHTPKRSHHAPTATPPRTQAQPRQTPRHAHRQPDARRDPTPTRPRTLHMPATPSTRPRCRRTDASPPRPTSPPTPPSPHGAPGADSASLSLHPPFTILSTKYASSTPPPWAMKIPEPTTRPHRHPSALRPPHHTNHRHPTAHHTLPFASSSSSILLLHHCGHPHVARQPSNASYAHELPTAPPVKHPCPAASRRRRHLAATRPSYTPPPALPTSTPGHSPSPTSVRDYPRLSTNHSGTSDAPIQSYESSPPHLSHHLGQSPAAPFSVQRVHPPQLLTYTLRRATAAHAHLVSHRARTPQLSVPHPLHTRDPSSRNPRSSPLHPTSQALSPWPHSDPFHAVRPSHLSLPSHPLAHTVNRPLLVTPRSHSQLLATISGPTSCSHYRPRRESIPRLPQSPPAPRHQ